MDTAGQERFHSLGPIYYRDADGAILVYDITDVTSFERVQAWVKELRQVVGDIQITIAANKIDLESKRTVDNQIAEEYATKISGKHFQVSAKTNKGVDELFSYMAKRLDETDKSSHGLSNRKPAGSTGVFLDSHTPKKKSEGCC
eukprot:TRINITY_DN4027_c0_g1_i1.p1 TRINITY_DN4027_c0_g1~~TRINITY_DN4027_c0_g1_i1.p1  ORF type:complete len:144 (-),score=41.17 TRINITY_DN4027_c0_g1_i1:72-503(-)